MYTQRGRGGGGALYMNNMKATLQAFSGINIELVLFLSFYIYIYIYIQSFCSGCLFWPVLGVKPSQCPYNCVDITVQYSATGRK